jgi:soluble lytic murein transglycosylase-like protein
MMAFRLITVSLTVFGLMAASAPAHAELVFFTTGRTLSVKAARTDGDSVVLKLRSGGEVVCERSVIARIEPDEVPYPEPEPEVHATVDAAPVTSAPYDALIERLATQQNVPAKLVKAVITVESNYQERARSRKGAMGLMQLMPETARRYAVADPYEASSNIEGGIKYLRFLLDQFDLKLALAAYNAGEAAVRRFGGIPPYPETRQYVDRVLEKFLR